LNAEIADASQAARDIGIRVGMLGTDALTILLEKPSNG
jgi:uncharacterized protein YunC (DUF1805 family)